MWLLDFDASGRLVSRVQGLTISRVTQVTQGQTQAEVGALIDMAQGSLGSVAHHLRQGQRRLREVREMMRARSWAFSLAQALGQCCAWT